MGNVVRMLTPRCHVSNAMCHVSNDWCRGGKENPILDFLKVMGLGLSTNEWVRFGSF